MKNLTPFKAAFAIAALLVLAATGAHAATMDKATYQAEKTRISTEFKNDKAYCVSMASDARASCGANAKSKFGTCWPAAV